MAQKGGTQKIQRLVQIDDQNLGAKQYHVTLSSEIGGGKGVGNRFNKDFIEDE